MIGLRLTTILAALLSMTCSAIGLTNEMDIATCADQPPDFCESLNDLHPTNDGCRRWGCDQETGLCEVLPADRDYDGVPAPGCGEAGEAEDCDESEPTIHPEAPELCDGLDNDCDGLIDEGAFTVEGTDLDGLSETDDVAEIDHALGVSGQLALVALSGLDRDEPAAGLYPPEVIGGEPREASRLEIIVDFDNQSLPSRAIAVAGLTSGFVVALTAATLDCERVLLAELAEGGESLALHFDEAEDLEHFEQGLFNDLGERCLDEGSARDLAIAASGDELLLAYHVVDSDDGERSLCNDPEDLPPTAPVWLSYGRRRGGVSAGLARDELPAAVELTLSTDSGRPALLAVDQGQWLVAVAGAGGDLELHHVLRVIEDDFSRSLEVSQIGTIAAAGAPLGEATLALSPESDDDEQILAVAARRGCRGEAEVMIQRYALSLGPSPQLVPLEESTRLGGDDESLRRPTLAYWPGAQEWLVAAQRGDFNLAAWRLDDEGVEVGDAPLELLEVTGAGRPRLAERAFLFSPSDERGGYWLVAHQPGAEAGFKALRITCDGR